MRSVLVALDRRRAAGRLLAGMILFGCGALYAFVGAGGRSGYLRAVSPVVGVISALAAIGAAGVLITHVVTGFAAIQARGSRVELVYPFGLHRLVRRLGLDVPGGEVPSLKQGLGGGRNLVEFSVEVGSEHLTTRMSPDVLEADALVQFERRAHAHFNRGGGGNSAT